MYALPIFRTERRRLRDAEIEIVPIGEEPDGTRFTGFQARVDDASGYLVLLREVSAGASYTYHLTDAAGCTTASEPLATNLPDGAWSVAPTVAPDGGLEVRLDRPRSYLFLRYRASSGK